MWHYDMRFRSDICANASITCLGQFGEVEEYPHSYFKILFYRVDLFAIYDNGSLDYKTVFLREAEKRRQEEEESERETG